MIRDPPLGTFPSDWLPGKAPGVVAPGKPVPPAGIPPVPEGAGGSGAPKFELAPGGADPLPGAAPPEAAPASCPFALSKKPQRIKRTRG